MTKKYVAHTLTESKPKVEQVEIGIVMVKDDVTFWIIQQKIVAHC